MRLDEIQKILGADLLIGSKIEEIEIGVACGADLMSDVLAFAETGSLLLTGLTNTQVVRTAEMADVSAICFVRGKAPPRETVELARKDGLPLLTTRLPMFESCGRLYEVGLRGCTGGKDAT